MGATHFKDSSQIEGCTLVQSSKENQSTHSFVSNHCQPVSGYKQQVWSNTYEYREKFREQRKTTDFLCFPSTDCLLVAHDKKSLEEILARSQQDSNEGLPPKLERWRSEIHPRSPVWGIRAENCQITDMTPYYGEPPPDQMPKSSSSSLTADWTNQNTVRIRLHGWNPPKAFEQMLNLKFSQKEPGEFEAEISPQTIEEENRKTATTPNDNPGLGNSYGLMKLSLLLGFRWWI